MKILFVVKSKAIETLGVMYLSAVARKRGHETTIVAIDDAVKVSSKWKPDYVGFSVMTGDQERMKVLARKIRGKNNPKILYGGPHVTFFSEDFIGEDATLFTGEAEKSLDSFLDTLDGRGDNAYGNIDSLPWPDRKDFPNHRIRDFITSRGCPFKCSYCYNKQWNQLSPGPSVRTRNVEDVIREIVNVNPEFAYFQDSCFGVDMAWLREFSKKYRMYANIPYHCHLRPSQVTEERILLLHDSACASIRFALETASKPLLKLLNREKTDLLQVESAARLLRKWGIKFMVQNMIGLPTGTIEDDLQTLAFNIKLKPNYAWVSIFQPYPGTELGEFCEKNGHYKGDYSEIGDNFFDGSVLNFSHTYKEQLACLQKIFALAVHCSIVPSPEELKMDYFPKLVHKMTRAYGDRQLYPGVM